MRSEHARTITATTIRVVGVSLIASVLSACQKQPAATTVPPVVVANSTSELAELEWARHALSRNPTLEIVATDTSAGVFTVRLKDSGEVRTIKLSDLAAAPVSTLLAAAPASDMPEPESTPATASATPDGTSTAPEPAAATPPHYTIDRTGGQLKVTGPGVSIVSTGGAASPAGGASIKQRGTEPIICEGRRMLHLDNRNIDVEGDAIIARGGCELYITNSRIAADGTGVFVRDAIVHITNSTIAGSTASFDADDNSKVYLRSSSFQGLPRRSQQAVVQDQGGNQWR